MRILLVIDSLGSGGAQRQMTTLARGLAKAGHEVEFFVYHDERHFADAVEELSIPIHLFQKSARFSLRPVFDLRRLLKSRRYDVALAFLDTPSLYLELASVGLSEPKIVVSERSVYDANNLGFRHRVLNQFHRLADWITVNSHHQKAQMLIANPWMHGRLETVWNGCDLTYFDAQKAAPPASESVRLLVLASVARKKNPLNLAKALQLCRDDHRIRVEVNWAGTFAVTGDNGSTRQETDAYLASAGLDDQWAWLGEVQDVRPLLAAHDALIHPSNAEGLPNAICEALASGVPVLASDIGDHSRIVKDGETGFIFAPSSPESIAAAIFRFSRMSAHERDVMRRSARRFAAEHLSNERFVSNYESLFKRLSGR